MRAAIHGCRVELPLAGSFFFFSADGNLAQNWQALAKVRGRKESLQAGPKLFSLSFSFAGATTILIAIPAPTPTPNAETVWCRIACFGAIVIRLASFRLSGPVHGKLTRASFPFACPDLPASRNAPAQLRCLPFSSRGFGRSHKSRRSQKRKEGPGWPLDVTRWQMSVVVAPLKCHVWATWREFPDGRIQRHLGSDTSTALGSANFEKDHPADCSVEFLAIDSRVVAYESPPMRGQAVEHQQQLTPSRPCANPDAGTR